MRKVTGLVTGSFFSRTILADPLLVVRHLHWFDIKSCGIIGRTRGLGREKVLGARVCCLKHGDVPLTFLAYCLSSVRPEHK